MRVQTAHHGGAGDFAPGIIGKQFAAGLVMTDALAAGWVPQTPFMVRIDHFAEEGSATRYTATARHWDAATCDRHAAMGFAEGWGVCADQLAQVARRIA